MQNISFRLFRCYGIQSLPCSREGHGFEAKEWAFRGLGFRGLGFRGLGFRGLGSRVSALPKSSPPAVFWPHIKISTLVHPASPKGSQALYANGAQVWKRALSQWLSLGLQLPKSWVLGSL